MDGAFGLLGLRMTRPCVAVWSSVAPSSRSRRCGGDDDLEAADLGPGVGADLVAERGLGDDVEAEVVLEVLARVADDLEAQTRGDRPRARRRASVTSSCKASGVTVMIWPVSVCAASAASGLTAGNAIAAIRRPAIQPPPLHSMRWPVT